jgi:hypothetical protein
MHTMDAAAAVAIGCPMECVVVQLLRAWLWRRHADDQAWTLSPTKQVTVFGIVEYTSGGHCNERQGR